MKQFIIFIALAAVLFNTSCKEEEDEFLIGRFPFFITRHPILYGEAEYVKDYFDSTWTGLDSTFSHFDSTIVIDKITSDDSLFSVMYGFPILYKSDGPDTEVTFLGGFLGGDRPPYPYLEYDCFDCPSPSSYDSIVYDTIYDEYPIHPPYAIFEIQSEGQTTIDTVIFGQNDMINEIYMETIGKAYGWTIQDSLLTDFMSNSEFTSSELHSQFDHNIINSPETYEVYFIDLSSGSHPQPAAVDLKFYIKNYE